MAKRSPEKFKTWGNVFDNFTIVTLQKIIDKRIIDGLQGPLKIGKESNVFIAKKDDENVIAKIYRLEVSDFKTMYSYLRYDPRYENLKKNRRQTIFSWVQREFRNLHIARESGIRVPTPYHISNNVLIEEFIGDKHDALGAAPQLKDQYPKDPQAFYHECLEMVEKLLRAGLVHADLSQFNILNSDEEPVFIDFSQSTPLENPRAKEYFDNDAKNLVNFFNKAGAKAKREDFQSIWIRVGREKTKSKRISPEPI